MAIIIESLILALSLSLPLSIAATNICLGAVSAALLAHAWRGAALPWKKTARSPVFLALGFYLAAAVLSSLQGVDPSHSLSVFYKDLHKLWVFYVLALALRVAPSPKAFLGLGAAFALLAGLGIWQSLGSLGAPVWARAHGFVHPVTYGEQMALAVLGALCLAREPQAHAFRVWIWAGLVLTAAALLCNQSWGALVGVAAGLIILALAKKFPLRALAPTVLILVGALALFELLPTGRSLVGSIRSLQTKSHDLQGPFQRVILWKVAWKTFLDQPLTGVGPGNYRQVFSRHFQGKIEGASSFGSAHNLYLHQLAERGLIGLLALLGILWALLARAWTRARAQDDFPGRWALAVTAALPAMSLTEEAFQNELLLTLVLLIWSWAEALFEYN